MSERFLDLYIPCKECLVSPVCETKPNIESILNNYDLFQFMLALRKWDEKEKSYRKGLLEAWINLGDSLLLGLKTESIKHFKTQPPLEFINFLIELNRVLQWMLYSESWKSGKAKSSDREILREKMKQAIVWI